VELKRAEGKFDFPYGFKHGVVLEITGEEYERIERMRIKRAVKYRGKK